MKPIFFAAIIAATSFAATAQAKIIECSFDSFKGAQTQSITVSWTGTKFRVDTDNNVVQQGAGNEWWNTMAIDKTKSSKDFTTYSSFVKHKDTSNRTHRLKYAFRVYNDGRSRLEVRQDRYLPMIATGTC